METRTVYVVAMAVAFLLLLVAVDPVDAKDSNRILSDTVKPPHHHHHHLHKPETDGSSGSGSGGSGSGGSGSGGSGSGGSGSGGSGSSGSGSGGSGSGGSGSGGSGRSGGSSEINSAIDSNNAHGPAKRNGTLLLIGAAAAAGAAVAAAAMSKRRVETEVKAHPLKGSVNRRVELFSTLAGKGGGARPPRTTDIEMAQAYRATA